MIRTKGDVLERLRAAGYSAYRLRRDKLLGQRTIMQLRNGEEITHGALNTVCRLLGCQVGDVLEYVPDSDGERVHDADTAAPAAQDQQDGSTGATG